ncbi:hypothetical protein MIMGU_mgv1a0190602mg, partial [Erythranthe guttata]
MAILIHCPCNS